LHIDNVCVSGHFAENVRRGSAEAGMSSTALHVCDTLESLAVELKKTIAPDDVLLLKGSRKMKMESILDFLKQEAPAGAPQK